MKKIVISIITITLFFSGILRAENNKILETITSSKNGETADLTKEQLKDCISLQNKLDKQAKIIEQANFKLESIKTEIEKRTSYIKEKRSQVNDLSDKQIEDINIVITKQKQDISYYNDKVDFSEDKFNVYHINKKAFSIDCADKSYNADDMKVVTDELESKKNKYSLMINVSPATSKIRIMNIVPKYNYGILLKPSKYDIYITRSGYHEYRKWIEIKDSDVNIDVVLQKK
ncbi:MAG: hypothetical protein QM487_09720 [Candidatus Marithrix sp.]